MTQEQQPTQGTTDADAFELVPPPPAIPRKRSRDYTPDERRTLVEWICAKAAEGGENNTFRSAAKEVGIARGTLFHWIEADKDLKKLWESARIWQCHSSVEDMLELADGATGGKNGDVDKRRLQVDARKFFAIKVAPRIYGDKLELAGPNGTPLAPPSPTKFDASKLSTEELENLEALMSKATVLNIVEPVQAVPGSEQPLALPASVGGPDGRP